ncbi:hypothetical protein NB037_01890 [Rathayibacter sp. ZW T2_19]|uniref:Transcriptional regulator, PaaX family n=1 Tax=Rathayibacter rubneri TaxID=2950106 RepID=A0A9X2IT06_9MICO|nr:PaaX family transcriptional regulator C-terminal domain-containing protein [Rathayibacter rubneri]MCM6761159.1 hypothetical protein [Rathayibacter rubneri]
MSETDHGMGYGRRATAPEALLSVLGEYVAPTFGGAWQETLVSAIELFGHSTAAARQATARAVRDGALVAHRSGRRSWLQLADGAAQMLKEAGVMTSGSAMLSTGLWDVFILRAAPDAPSSARTFHPRVQMLLGSLGTLARDVYIAPSNTGSAMARQALEEEPGLSVIVLRSEISSPEVSDVVAAAWDLAAARGAYERLLEDFGTRTPVTDDECFVAWMELQRQWRQCMRGDPGLPTDVLPTSWPRTAAEMLVARRRVDWGGRAAVAFDRLGAGLPARPNL